MNHDFSPLNNFESNLARAQRGEGTVSELMEALVLAELAVPSASAFQQDWSGFRPLLFFKNGVPMLACFSAKERLAEYSDMTPFCLLVKGRELLRRIPPKHGLVINPGQRIGFDASPEGLAQIVSDFTG